MPVAYDGKRMNTYCSCSSKRHPYITVVRAEDNYFPPFPEEHNLTEQTLHSFVDNLCVKVDYFSSLEEISEVTTKMNEYFENLLSNTIIAPVSDPLFDDFLRIANERKKFDLRFFSTPFTKQDLVERIMVDLKSLLQREVVRVELFSPDRQF